LKINYIAESKYENCESHCVSLTGFSRHLAPLLSTNVLGVDVVMEKMGTARDGQIVLTGAIDKIWPGNWNPWSAHKPECVPETVSVFIPD
jgi:hypothetical protein